MSSPISKREEPRREQLDALERENDLLRKENARLKTLLMNDDGGAPVDEPVLSDLKPLTEKALTIVVVGASGDLAKKKTYPALFALYIRGLLPEHAQIVGYSRSELKLDEFRSRIMPGLRAPKLDNVDQATAEKKKQRFIEMLTYVAGSYDEAASFQNLDAFLKKCERKDGGKANRLFYFAIPPSVFASTAKGIKKNAMSLHGWNRVVVEKPFGRDSVSSAELGRVLLSEFKESQLYRIDHYLGKEMVQNIMTLRFANSIFEPLWNNRCIDLVTITFKEPIGTQGRGGYFDEFGIIRDVMQNHLTQILSLIAMESPVSLGAEDVRDEKVKVLKAIEPVPMERVVLGQYVGDKSGKEVGYLDDPGVPKNSVTPTFAMAVLFIKNQRWDGVPFILKCGKALNERKAEIRMQFKRPPGELYGPNKDVNELVIRVQPSEAIYAKMHTKKPGLIDETEMSELDLTYTKRFSVTSLPDAYERLILDVLRGDHNLFVRSDELSAAWDIFTPILNRIETDRIKPINYEFGSRGPLEADQLAQAMGFKRSSAYKYPSHL